MAKNIVGLIVGLLLFGQGEAEASMCIDGHPPVDKEYAASSFVVDAKVSEVQKDISITLSYKGEKYADIIDRIVLHVVKLYKGEPQRSLTFDNPHTSAAFPIQKGERYLIFLKRRGTSGGLYIDTCGSSGAVADTSKKTLETVERLATGAH
jgi:hypothetical protein